MTRSEPITVSSVRNTASSVNTITNKFPRPYISENDTLALRSLTIPYNWFNVTSTYANTQVSYTWVDGTTHVVNYIPGSYSIDNLSAYLQLQMLNNGHVLLGPNGPNDYRYFLEFNANVIYGTVTLTCSPVPTVLPAGWSNPYSVPLNGMVPQLVVTNAAWGRLIGFALGSYPPTLASTAQAYNSTSYPIIANVNIVNMTCSWLYNNQFSTIPSLLYSFVPNGPPGSTLFIEPSALENLQVMRGQYDEISLSFFDENYQPLQLQDKQQIQARLLLTHDV